MPPVPYNAEHCTVWWTKQTEKHCYNCALHQKQKVCVAPKMQKKVILRIWSLVVIEGTQMQLITLGWIRPVFVLVQVLGCRLFAGLHCSMGVPTQFTTCALTRKLNNRLLAGLEISLPLWTVAHTWLCIWVSAICQWIIAPIFQPSRRTLWQVLVRVLCPQPFHENCQKVGLLQKTIVCCFWLPDE